ncbi:MAG TPA: LysR family transcriptional regulator [Pseudonocardia sp.]
MELRQLRVFLVVAEERSFTRAAARLFLAQSAVSAAIRSLERDLRVSLIDRSTQPIDLTTVGRVFREHALATVAAADRARAAAKETEGTLQGTVRLGLLGTRRVGAISMASLITTFMDRHPRVTIAAEQVGGSPRQLAAVRDGRLDLAFVSSQSEHVSGVRLLPLAQEPVALVCHPAHSLPETPDIRLVDLVKETFVELPPDWTCSVVVNRAFARIGLPHEVRYRVNDLTTLADFIVNDFAVTLLPPSPVPADPNLRMVPVLDAPVYKVQLALPIDRVPSAATRAFCDAIQDSFSVGSRVDEASMVFD